MRQLNLCRILTTLVSLGALCGAVMGQNVSKMKVQPQRQDKMLHVYVSPYDASGKFIRGIQKDQFRIAINGQPAKVVSFSDQRFNGHKKFAALIVLDTNQDAGFERRREIAASLASWLSSKENELTQVFFAGPSRAMAGAESLDPLEVAQTIRGAKSEAGDGSYVIQATDMALAKAATLDKFRAAVFVVSSDASLGGGIGDRGSAEPTPLYVLYGGSTPNELLGSHAVSSGGSVLSTEGGDVTALAKRVVNEARTKVADQYAFSVQSPDAIPFYYQVTVTYPTATGEQTLSDESIPRWMVLVPAGSFILLIVLAAIMFASYRRVISKLRSSDYNPDMPILDQLHAGASMGMSEKIQLAADKMTTRLMRLQDTGAATVAKPTPEDEPTRTSDDEPTLARGVQPQRLALVGELRPGQPFRFDLDRELSVGRSNSDVVIPDGSVSRKHARFLVDSGAVYLEDLGSTNGTRLNGKPVRDRVQLHAGDKIEFGDTRASIASADGPSAREDDTMAR